MPIHGRLNSPRQRCTTSRGGVCICVPPCSNNMYVVLYLGVSVGIYDSLATWFLIMSLPLPEASAGTHIPAR